MAVTSLLTSLEDFEAPGATYTGINSGPGASDNTDIFIEGAQSGGRRVDNVTDKGFLVSVPSTDLSAAGEHIKHWVFVTQWPQVTALNVRFGSGTSIIDTDDHSLPVAEFPTLGGFVPVWVDCDRTPERAGASTNLAAVTQSGAMISIGNVGGAADNFIVDEILHGTSGLQWTGTSGTISDFRTYEDTNAEGVLVVLNGIDFCYARLELGDGATATSFTMQDGSLIFPDQSLVESTWMGVTVDASLAGDTFTFADQTIASSDVVGAGTRPDFIVTGTAATVNLNSGTLMLGLRQITMTSAVTVTGGTYDAIGITQGNADISGCTIQTRAATSVATITDPDFTNLADIDFAQSGAGHALEISAAGTYTLNGLRGLDTTGGFGADTTDSAALDITASTGTVTLNITNGGATPTYKTAGATVVINNAVDLTVTVTDSTDGSALQDARVYLTADTGGPETVGTVLINELTTAAGVATESYAYTSDQPVTGWVRKSTTPGALYKEASLTGTITSGGYTQSAPMTPDE